MSHAENAINSAQWAASRANDSAETVAAFSAEAQVYASLAVAEAIDRLTEQQRLANVIDYYRAGWNESSPLAPLVEYVEKGLGL